MQNAPNESRLLQILEDSRRPSEGDFSTGIPVPDAHEYSAFPAASRVTRNFQRPHLAMSAKRPWPFHVTQRLKQLLFVQRLALATASNCMR